MRNVDISAVQEFLLHEIEPKELAGKLEAMVWDYVGYVLRNSELCGAPEVAEDLYWIREFITALKQVG